LEITPPQLSKFLIQTIQKQALLAHQTLGCSGMSRSDFILVGKIPWILEINTIPGLTPTSLIPQEAQARGINYSQLLNILIKAAQARFHLK